MYAPLSMFRWQMYAAQGMRNRWYSVLGEDFVDSSDEDQDSLKVELSTCLCNCSHGQWALGSLSCVRLSESSQPVMIDFKPLTLH